MHVCFYMSSLIATAPANNGSDSSVLIGALWKEILTFNLMFDSGPRSRVTPRDPIDEQHLYSSRTCSRLH